MFTTACEVSASNLEPGLNIAVVIAQGIDLATVDLAISRTPNAAELEALLLELSAHFASIAASADALVAFGGRDPVNGKPAI